MSATYSLGCRDCKKKIWIAQGTGYRCLYSGNQKCMEALREFLFDHEEHNLVFADNINNEEMLSWDDIEYERE